MTDSGPFNIIDRVIAWAAPEAGLRRLRARAALDMTTRVFDAAKSDRRTLNWNATGAAANTENWQALNILRFRARDLERNNPLASSAIQQFAGMVVGTGITPRPVHPLKTMRKRALEAWTRFADSCDPEGQHDFYGLSRLAVSTMFRDGEVLQTWLPDGNKPNSFIRLMEADHLDMGRFALQTSAGNRVVQGIEVDLIGRRKGYWLYPVHPGETGIIPARRVSQLVPAGDVDHMFHALRIGQQRGVSWLAPAMLRMRGLDDINEAMIWRKRMESCIGLVLSSPEVQGGTPVIGKQKLNANGDPALPPDTLEQFSPGMVFRGGPGESVQAFTPSADPGAVDFIRTQLYSICAVTGLPYHVITGDASQANYSSLRAATLAGYVILDMVQNLVVIPRQCKPAWRRVMQREALLTGDDRFLDVSSQWGVPVRPWVDPAKDIASKIAEIRAGLTSMPDALNERGLDAQQQIETIAAFLKECDANGVVLDTDSRRAAAGGAAMAAADPVAKDPASDPAAVADPAAKEAK